MDNVVKTKEYFDKFFLKLDYIKSTKQSIIIKSTYDAIRKELYGEVLDIGSGCRVDYIRLADIKRLVGIDLSLNSILNTEISKNFNVIFILADARNLPFKDNYFDVVISLHTLHHFSNNTLKETRYDLLITFKEIYRVLKKGGKVLIVDAFINKTMQKLEDSLFKFSVLFFNILNKPIVYYFSINDVVKILKLVGFSKIEYKGLNTYNAMFCPFNSSFGIPFRYTPLSHFLVKGLK